MIPGNYSAASLAGLLTGGATASLTAIPGCAAATAVDVATGADAVVMLRSTSLRCNFFICWIFARLRLPFRFDIVFLDYLLCLNVTNLWLCGRIVNIKRCSLIPQRIDVQY